MGGRATVGPSAAQAREDLYSQRIATLDRLRCGQSETPSRVAAICYARFNFAGLVGVCTTCGLTIVGDHHKYKDEDEMSPTPLQPPEPTPPQPPVSEAPPRPPIYPAAARSRPLPGITYGPVDGLPNWVAQSDRVSWRAVSGRIYNMGLIKIRFPGNPFLSFDRDELIKALIDGDWVLLAVARIGSEDTLVGGMVVDETTGGLASAAWLATVLQKGATEIHILPAGRQDSQSRFAILTDLVTESEKRYL